MESKALPIVSHDARYVRSFLNFAALSDKFSEYAKWVDDVFNEAVVAKIQAKLYGQKELRVLGVGSGTGEMDCYMLEKLLHRFPRINNRVVEPIQEMLVQYKALVQSNAHELHGVSFDWRQQTIENYEQAGDVTKFHFISAIHSVYHIAEDADSVLTKLYNRLEPGGVMLVIINSDKSPYFRFQSRVSSVVGHFNVISSATIRSSLDRLGIPYMQQHHPVSINITQCFDEASEDGRLMMDFITNVVKFKETMSEDVQRELMEYLASDCSEKTSGGKTLMRIDWDAIFINKPIEY